MTAIQLKEEVACPRLADLAKQRHHRDDLPAYPEARFNAAGFCTIHNTVQLCKVTNIGKYKKYQILHKVCSMCEARSHHSRSERSHRLRSEERFYGGISRTLSGESTDSGERGPPPSRRQWERRGRLKSRNGEVRSSRRRRSHSRPRRKVVVRKQSSSPVDREEDDKPSISPPLSSDEAIIKDLTRSDLPNDGFEKHDVVTTDDATLPTLPCTISQASEWSSKSSISSANLKQKIRNLSGLLLSIQMKDSADKLSTIPQDDQSPIGVRSHQSEELSKKQIESYNTIRDDASATYLYRKSKRDHHQSSSKNRVGKVVAFRE